MSRTEPRSPDHPTQAVVDLDALLHNLRQLQKRLKNRSQVLAVIKANAYGHGAVPVAKALSSAGVRFFGVAFVEEGAELRRAGITEPVLVMAGFTPEQAPALLEHRLTPVLYHEDQLRWLGDGLKTDGSRLAVHVKVDTGMGRLGLLPGDVLPFVRDLLKIKGLKLEGLMTHFADEDLQEAPVVREQIRVFSKVYEELKAEGIVVPHRHMGNSAAILNLEEAWWDWVRAGIALYGYAPSRNLESAADLRPVMSLTSRIIHLRRLPAGATISYGRTFRTSRESRIAVVPMGYADGYPRALSNRGSALARGRRVPVVGRVCMDMMMLDVTDVPDIRMGDEVVLIGRQGSERITASEMAEQAGTIPYEILTAIGSRVPRVYIGRKDVG